MAALLKVMLPFLIMTVCLLLFLYQLPSMNLQGTSEPILQKWNMMEPKTPSQLRKNKTILFWHRYYHKTNFGLGLGSQLFQNCEYKNCFTTTNKQLLPVDQFDAIMFHGFDYEEARYGKPSKRNPDQIYIFFNLESPVRTTDALNLTNDFYNWTMTYRTDSDIWRPYFHFTKETTSYRLPSPEQISAKPKKIAWFVSNCHSRNNREELFQEINKHLPVDVFGDCGNLSCSNKDGVCDKLLKGQYKFYLAFENSNCADYVTEKTFRGFASDVVPIVYGGADYHKLTPPRSVINVQDFATVKNLSDYIAFLDQNATEYLRYLEWKKHYRVNNWGKSAICDLCKKLNGPIEPKTYNIVDWWRGENSEICSNFSIVP